MDHCLDEIAGHAREFDQAGHVLLEQRTDDVVDVASGAKVAAAGSEHHRADIVGGRKIPEKIAQFRVAFEGQRVFSLRPVEGDDSHVADAPPVEMPGGIVCHRAHVRASSCRNLSSKAIRRVTSSSR